MKLSKEKGFTIVELLVVIIVIAILATISVVLYVGIKQRAYESSAMTQLAQIRKEMEVYKVMNGEWPFQAELDTIKSQQPNLVHPWCSAAIPYIRDNTSFLKPGNEWNQTSCAGAGGSQKYECLGVSVSERGYANSSDFDSGKSIWISPGSADVSPPFEETDNMSRSRWCADAMQGGT